MAAGPENHELSIAAREAYNATPRGGPLVNPSRPASAKTTPWTDTSGQSKRADDLLSVVIPAYNEQDTILPLAQTIATVMAEMQQPYEILFVDDGSSDATFQQMMAARTKDPNVHIIRLMRNFGQTA